MSISMIYMIILMPVCIFTATATYTQLSGGRTAPSSYSQAAWPQWQATSESGSTPSQTPSQAPTSAPAPSAQGANIQQGEEFTDMLHMLQNTGSEFNDISGMFNQFTE